MKSHLHLPTGSQFVAATLVSLAILLATGMKSRATDSPPPPLFTSISVTNGQVSLAWSNGVPTYQVQRCVALDQPWQNVGAPTNVTSVTFPQVGDQAYYRVIADFTARYIVTFNATWSQATHPSNWPANPHFSGLVGGTHNDSVHFYRVGETASEGIRLMAELGQKPVLLNEVAAAITNGTAQLQLNGGGINPSPGSVFHYFPQPMRRDFPLVSLVSMIAPSPDWFVGVDSLSLLDNGQWATNKTVSVFGMDAGTDSGVSYSSPDQATVPRGVVTEFTDFPALVNGVIVPFGTFTFTRY